MSWRPSEEPCRERLVPRRRAGRSPRALGSEVPGLSADGAAVLAACAAEESEPNDLVPHMSVVTALALNPNPAPPGPVGGPQVPRQGFDGGLRGFEVVEARPKGRNRWRSPTNRWSMHCRRNGTRSPS